MPEAGVMADAASALFEERDTRSGMCVGVATLNSPKRLNGLSFDMVTLLLARLSAWAADPRVAAVVLHGAGDKAFSAGGDLHSLYRGILEQRAAGTREPSANRFASEFFKTEYQLDYLIHRYPKPVLCWGHGIVMGGGVGLMVGASHRVVTESSRVAMPEIAIGLFPDVGASWFLPRVPGHGGRFMALTGAQLNAADAIFAGLADVHIRVDARDRVFMALETAPWNADPMENRRVLSGVLREFAEPNPVAGPLQQHLPAIRAACGRDTVDDAAEAIVRLPQTMERENSWIGAAIATLRAGSPATARLAWELQARAKLLSLADAFRLEHTVALHCAAQGDLAEGIRALLIDKDHKPKWQHASLQQATASWAEAYFVPPWPNPPLAQLGNTP